MFGISTARLQVYVAQKSKYVGYQADWFCLLLDVDCSWRIVFRRLANSFVQNLRWTSAHTFY